MTLEQLQAMSDAQLNELSAVKVMGWDKRCASTAYFMGDEIMRTVDEASYSAWIPTVDMNDAMLLFNKLHPEMWEMDLHCDHQIKTPWVCKFYFNDGFNKEKRIKLRDKTASRAITIASILSVTA